MKTSRSMRMIAGALSLSIAAAALPGTARSAVIPHDLDPGGRLSGAAPARPPAALAARQARLSLERAGLSPEESAGRVRSLDAVEMARLQRSDLRQRGGDVLIPILAIVGIVAIVLWLRD